MWNAFPPCALRWTGVVYYVVASYYAPVAHVGVHGMRKRTFKIDIVGPGVSPETTRASDLADLMVQVERAIVETARAQGADLPDEAVVSLVAVGEGSNSLTLAVADCALPATSSISHAVSADDYESIPPQAHEALYEISKQAVRQDWTVNFVPERSPRIEGAAISSEHEVPPPPVPPHVVGTTTVFGRCVAVGGVTRPKARIRLQNGDLLYVDVTEQLAKKLAKNLYDQVCVEGAATWRTDDWTLLRFDAVRVTDFRPTDAVAAFEKLSAAAGGRWDEVDAVEYVRQLRRGGSEG